ncbi:MAG: DUF3169 family protein [Erysipelotrichaceae bacterium]|nr:DUF3169 family protein [Erysipelotrichaceae bacterium]MDY5251492.1 DUF3169 family protein [Erysipelotrichaceae bacterium]
MKNKTKYVLFYVTCMMIGVALYFLASFISMLNIQIDLSFVDGIMAIFSIIFSSVASFVGVVMYHKASKIITNGIDDEDDFNKANQLTSIANAMLQLSMPMIIMGIALVTKFEGDIPLSSIILSGWLLLVLIASIVYLKKVFAIISKIYPEKGLSSDDIYFENKWFGSCDESERLMIYKASNQSFKFMNIAYCVTILVCMLLVKIHIMPSILVILISILWALQIASYFYNAYMLEHHPRKIKV